MAKRRSVCLVGGAGYIGTALRNKLLDEGYNVTVVDPMWAWEGNIDFPKPSSFLRGSFTHINAPSWECEHTIAQHDVVIWLASIHRCGDTLPSLSIEPVNRTMNKGPLSVYEKMADDHNKHFIYFSSARAIRPADEPYDSFKAMAEWNLRELQQDIARRPGRKMPFAPWLNIVRPGTVYGGFIKGLDPIRLGTAVNRFIAAPPKSLGRAEVLRGLMQGYWRAFVCHIDRVVAETLLLVKHCSTPDKVVLCEGTGEWQWNDLDADITPTTSCIAAESHAALVHAPTKKPRTVEEVIRLMTNEHAKWRGK